MGDLPEAGGNLQSVKRALRALELIAEAGELGVSELGRRLAVHKATASRLVATLAERGIVERAAMAGLDLVRTARPVLEELADRTRETVNLGLLSGDAVVDIDQVSGARSIVAVNWVGRRTPLHATSNGKVLLAWLDPEELGHLLMAPLERSTPSTITDVATLRVQLDEIRARGWAQTLEELEEGLNAVAAPIRDADGDVIAALSVSGPAFRMRPADLPRVGHMTMDAAGSVSRRLGYVERRRPAG